MSKDYALIANQYAQDVVDEKIIACKWVKLACKRHLSDLAKSASDDYLYEFNPELTDLKGKQYRPGQRICAFAELMPHIKGDWAARGMLITLEAWQVFILAVGFGWINKKTGKRRFSYIGIFVPRKNAKSTIAAIIGLYMLAFDGEFGAEVYSGATSKKQAFEVFKPARLMAIANAEYRSLFGVVPNISNLAIPDTNSKFEPVIGKPGDGASPSCAIVDEYHQHATNDQYETMETGMGARSQPILLVITTAGTDVSSPCYQYQTQLQKVLEATEEDDTWFGIIYTIDKDDDWATEAALIKANPNYGVSVDKGRMLALLAKSLKDPRKQAIYKTKHLDVWVASASPWLNLDALNKCGDPKLDINDFKGEACWVGLDLASKKDIASRTIEFKRNIDGKDHYYCFSKNYVPESAVEKEENAHYRQWVEQGFLTQTSGNMIDLELIQKEILEDTEQLGLQEVAKDPYGGQQLGANLANENIVVVDIPQRVSHLSEPMKDIDVLIEAGQFHHEANEAYVWMLSNVVVKPDHNENWFPRKQGDTQKTDAAISTIVAHGRAMLGETHSTKIKQGFVAL